MRQAEQKIVVDAIEEDVQEAIRMCDGDLRRAIRELILGQRDIDRTVSAGYVRRGLRS
jgi:hypothetical protein